MTDDTNNYRKKWKSNILENSEWPPTYGNLPLRLSPTVINSLKILNNLNTTYMYYIGNTDYHNFDFALITNLPILGPYLWPSWGDDCCFISSSCCSVHSNVCMQLAEIIAYSGTRTCIRKFTWFASTVHHGLHCCGSLLLSMRIRIQGFSDQNCKILHMKRISCHIKNIFIPSPP